MGKDCKGLRGNRGLVETEAETIRMAEAYDEESSLEEEEKEKRGVGRRIMSQESKGREKKALL